MARVLRTLLRGFRFRCPACGRGRFNLQRGSFEEGCLECSHVYLRDPGDWTGAAETSVLLTILVGFAGFYASGVAGLSLTWRLVVASLAAVGGLLLIYPRVKGLWIALIYLWDGPVVSTPPAPRREEAGPPDAPDASERERPQPVQNAGTKRWVRR